ncbi:V-type ATP synthase subunit E [uncultured archaeon]|nr:V-type ATP synthase subunit E [uncultured archaeon]
MGLQEVVHDILESAKSESAAILKAGNEKAKEIIKKAEAEVLIKRSSAEEDLARVKDADERKEMADAALQSKKELQNVKKELIEEAYSGLAEKISEMSEKDRANMLKILLEKAMAEIPDVGTIYVNKKDVKLAGTLVKSKSISIRPENIIGGIIAESSDGKLRTDYSFDRFIEMIKETRTKELSNILF